MSQQLRIKVVKYNDLSQEDAYTRHELFNRLKHTDKLKPSITKGSEKSLSSIPTHLAVRPTNISLCD